MQLPEVLAEDGGGERSGVLFLGRGRGLIYGRASREDALSMSVVLP